MSFVYQKVIVYSVSPYILIFSFLGNHVPRKIINVLNLFNKGVPHRAIRCFSASSEFVHQANISLLCFLLVENSTSQGLFSSFTRVWERVG